MTATKKKAKSKTKVPAKKKQLQPNTSFPLWEDGKCGYCGHQADMNGEEPFSYRLQCPECGRDGCDDCMPLGRNCRCPDCDSY